MRYTEENDALESLGDMFPEPERPPSPEPTFATYNREVKKLQQYDSDTSSDGSSSTWDSITIRLVGGHPLWGHYLWNAARSFATFIDLHSRTLCQGKAVLELGAGGGLPGIVSALNGARVVVLTDYPDHSLIQNLEHNVEVNVPVERRSAVHVMGYLWGKPTDGLLAAASTSSNQEGKFDVIILSDLVFNHSQHDALLTSCEEALSTSSTNSPNLNEPGTPCVLVFYSHHRPRYADRDLDFFRKARERGWICEKVVEERMEVMFPEDSGDEEVRGTVHGWRLHRNHID